MTGSDLHIQYIQPSTLINVAHSDTGSPQASGVVEDLVRSTQKQTRSLDGAIAMGPSRLSQGTTNTPDCPEAIPSLANSIPAAQVSC